MSRENVALFTKEMDKKPDLKARAVSNVTVASWVKVAHDAGFEFTAEEFASVIGETLNRTLTIDNAAREYVAAQAAMKSGELSEQVLAKAVAAAGVAANTFNVGAQTVTSEAFTITSHPFTLNKVG
jgi:hypothetical protein